MCEIDIVYKIQLNKVVENVFELYVPKVLD